MHRTGSLLLVAALATSLAGCEKPAPPPPPPPVKKVEAPKPPEPPKPEPPKAPEPPKEVMVKLAGKLATKVKGSSYELYVSRRGCEPRAATGPDLVGRIVPVPANLTYKLEVAVPVGVPLHLCALALDKGGKVIGAGGLPAPATFSGPASTFPSGINIVAAKAKEEPKKGGAPAKGGHPPKKGAPPKAKSG